MVLRLKIIEPVQAYLTPFNQPLSDLQGDMSINNLSHKFDAKVHEFFQKSTLANVIVNFIFSWIGLHVIMQLIELKLAIYH